MTSNFLLSRDRDLVGATYLRFFESPMYTLNVFRGPLGVKSIAFGIYLRLASIKASVETLMIMLNCTSLL